MSDMMKIVGSGVIGKEPEIRETKLNKKYVDLVLAVNEEYKNSKGELMKSTEWFNCRYFSKNVEAEITNFKKGDHVLVTGLIKLNRYKKGDNYEMYPLILANELSKLKKENSKSLNKEEIELLDEIPF
jgi:single-strand DNA-binding protein